MWRKKKQYFNSLCIFDLVLPTLYLKQKEWYNILSSNEFHVEKIKPKFPLNLLYTMANPWHSVWKIAWLMILFRKIKQIYLPVFLLHTYWILNHQVHAQTGRLSNWLFKKIVNIYLKTKHVLTVPFIKSFKILNRLKYGKTILKAL